MWALGSLLLAAALILLPNLLSLSQQEILVLLAINVLLVSSYRLLTLTGEWSLAHVVIMGVGAYGSALVAKKLGVPVPLSMLAGASIAALLAFLLSFPLFRMKGFYFLIGSFAAGEVIRLMWKWSDMTWLFGGPKGIKLIPPVPDIPLLSIDFYNPVHYYYLCLIVVAISLVILYRVEHSRIGLTFHAIHWQDKLAEFVGVSTFRYRTLAFVISSFFAGLAGALYAHYVGAIAPDRFNVEEMVYVLIWAIVGGTATFYGPILGVDRFDHSQRGGVASARRGRDAADVLRRDPHSLHSVPAERAGEPDRQGARMDRGAQAQARRRRSCLRNKQCRLRLRGSRPAPRAGRPRPSACAYR